MYKLGLYFFTSVNAMVLIPLYVCLAPFCIISSSLFNWVMSWIPIFVAKYQYQTVILVSILLLEWIVSAVLIFQLMIKRTGKNIFFYQFVFFLVCANFILIGITYSFLQRSNVIEQLAAKICTSLLLIFAAQNMKFKFGTTDQDSICSICLQKMNQQCIILKCKHYFHQTCLWQWAYVKQQCPSCKSQIL